MSILVTSAGRRVELIGAFQEAIKRRKLNSQVFAADQSPEFSAACQVADASFRLPSVQDHDYIDVLHERCVEHGIRMVVPAIDTELLMLAQNRKRFLNTGTQIVISDESLISACRDKRRTAELFLEMGIPTPRLFPPGEIEFPCFAKPFDGSSSVGAQVLLNAAALTPAIAADSRMMFMELIDSQWSEYTIDAYYNRKGKLCSFVPRQRIEVRAGEVSKGVTRRNGVYERFIERFRRLKGARGCITIQVFSDSTTTLFAAIEVNPRFGGGYPLTHAAGAEYVGWLVDEYMLGKEVSFFEEWEANLMMLRYDAKVIVHDHP